MQKRGDRNSWVFGRESTKNLVIGSGSKATGTSSLVDTNEEAEEHCNNNHSHVKIEDAAYSEFLKYIQTNEDISGEENNAIISWKDLSCSYASKTKCGKDITTLLDVTGNIQYKELVVIMVCMSSLNDERENH